MEGAQHFIGHNINFDILYFLIQLDFNSFQFLIYKF